MKSFLITFLIFLSLACYGQDYYSYKDVVRGNKPEQKWFYGGFASMGIGDNVLYVELGPEIYHKVSERIQLGAGGSLLYFGRDIVVSGQTFRRQSTSWGGRAFTKFKLFKPIYIRLEYEQLNIEYREPLPQAPFERVWNEGFHVGIELMKEDLIGQRSFFGIYYDLLYEKDVSPKFSAFDLRAGVYF